MIKHYLTLSVHQLVDFLLRTGDIDTRVFNRNTMQEGSRLHSIYQKDQGMDYLSEYALSCKIEYEDFEITLEGRADGINFKNNIWIIDEIKTSVQELVAFRNEQLEWHLGQAKCYAYMLALEKELSEVEIRIIYIRQGKKERMVDNYKYSFDELENYVFSLIEKYLDFQKILENKAIKRNETIQSLSFPFSKYRNGQRELAKYAYSIAKNGGRMYVEAPTGIGKTMSTLFPYIKAMEEGSKQKIFYLTAKNSGKEAAKHAIEILKDRGLNITEILIQAKDKICFCPGKGCNPDECPYTKGYYDKIKNIIRMSILSNQGFDSQSVIKIAKEYEICPFELELDLSLFSDVIICDYNYAFDPLVYMKRYFDDDTSSFLFLIDEAHNLVDRSKDMYSAALSKRTFDLAKKSLSKNKNANKLKTKLRRISNMFNILLESFSIGNTVIESFPNDVYKDLNYIHEALNDVNKNNHEIMTPELLDFMLDVSKFLKISEYIDSNYMSYINISSNKRPNVILKHYCLDASRYIKNRLDNIKGSILFSATLSPIDYYIDVLGGDAFKDPYLLLPSPFPKKNFKVLLAPKLSIKYTKRNESYPLVASYIKEFVSHKVGNYLIFFPSYEYLDAVKPYLSLEEYDVYSQNKDMKDEEKEEFIAHFITSPKKTTIGLAIIGGVFSEGIDLVDDRLIGAVIVGIGLPKVNFESDKISEYYNNAHLPGKEYAYINPGINKVMQALGRVIRSENDRGAVLLIDERYMSDKIAEVIKNEYPQYEVVLDIKDISNELSKFFLK